MLKQSAGGKKGIFVLFYFNQRGCPRPHGTEKQGEHETLQNAKLINNNTHREGCAHVTH